MILHSTVLTQRPSLWCDQLINLAFQLCVMRSVFIYNSAVLKGTCNTFLVLPFLYEFDLEHFLKYLYTCAQGTVPLCFEETEEVEEDSPLENA